jgi:hypothetical protein
MMRIIDITGERKIDKAIWICDGCGQSSVMTFPSAYMPRRQCNHNGYQIWCMRPVNHLAQWFDDHIEEWQEEWRKKSDERAEKAEYESKRLRALRGERPSLRFGK